MRTSARSDDWWRSLFVCFCASDELEYETELTNGRSVSAKLNPKDGSGDITYEDTKTLDATITASIS